MKKPYCIVTTTINCEKTANIITQTLLEEKLAACIQMIPITSHYRWKNKIQSSSEFLIQIKTKTSLFKDVKKQIELLHTYDIPEIIATEIMNANDNYLAWLEDETL